MKKITGKAQVISLERKREAVQLRKEGLTLTEIGRRLGVSAVMVHKYIKSELEAIRAETHETAIMERDIALMRLEAIIGKSYKAAMEGDWKAASLMLKAMERQAKLLGLDAPSKLEPIPPNHGTQRIKHRRYQNQDLRPRRDKEERVNRALNSETILPGHI